MPGPIKTKAGKALMPPLPVLLKTEHGEVKGQIMKLTTQGFMAEFEGLKLQPGDLVSASFGLPDARSGLAKGSDKNVTKIGTKIATINVTATGRTIKFYSQWVIGSRESSGKPLDKTDEKRREKREDKIPGKIGHLVEIHFVDIQSETLEIISAFLRSGANASDS